MNRSWSGADLRSCLIGSLGCALFGFVFQINLCASSTNAATEDRREPNPLNAQSQVECITPDGRVSLLSNSDSHAPATVTDDAIRCPLPEGETIFIIAFPSAGMLDRVTFVNENSAACGQLKIAVSNYHLPANSPEWTAVDGAIPFARKRLFNLSMIGVEAKYVKLSFHVQPENMAGISIDPRQFHRVATIAAN